MATFISIEVTAQLMKDKAEQIGDAFPVDDDLINLYKTEAKKILWADLQAILGFTTTTDANLELFLDDYGVITNAEHPVLDMLALKQMALHYTNISQTPDSKAAFDAAYFDDRYDMIKRRLPHLYHKYTGVRSVLVDIIR